MPVTTVPFQLSPSLVGRYFYLECDRFLRFRAATAEQRRSEQLPPGDFDSSPLMRDVMQSGYAWEETVIGEHLTGRVAIAPGQGQLSERKWDAAGTIAQLRDLPPGHFLYQGTLRVPASFYTTYGIDPALVRFSDCHPDLIQVVVGPNGQRLLRVLDVKRGESLQLSYRVQVLLYALILDAILTEYQITDVKADLDFGAVWLGNSPAPESVALSSLVPYLRQFLSERLPALLSAPSAEADWHLSFNCERCGYLQHCQQQMKQTDDVSRLTNLTAHGKRHLRALGVQTLDELRDFLAEPGNLDAFDRCASLARDRHYITGRLQAFAQNQPLAHDGLNIVPRGENIAIFITLQREPLGRGVYLAGLHLKGEPEKLRQLGPEVCEGLFGDTGKPVPLVWIADTPADTTTVRQGFIARLYTLLQAVDQFNQTRPFRDQYTVNVYTHSARDRALLTELLLDSMRDPNQMEAAITLLRHFQCPDLIEAEEHPDSPVPFPVIVLQAALTKLLALPIDVSYTLPETLAIINPNWNYTRKDHYQYPLGHGLRSDTIHAVWHMNRPEQLAGLRKEASAYLRALQALLGGMRAHVDTSAVAYAPKFRLPGRFGIDHPLLSRLAFIASYEAMLNLTEEQAHRAEPMPVRLRQDKVLVLEARGGNRFAVLQGDPSGVEVNSYKKWIISRDSRDGRLAQANFDDYKYRNKPFNGQSPHFSLAGVDHAAPNGEGVFEIRLAVDTWFDGNPPAVGDRVHMQARFTDPNTGRVIGVLKNQTSDSAFVKLLAAPHTIACDHPISPVVAQHAAQGEAALGLADSQLAAYRQVRQQRVVTLWGPPGTGKTHFLASTIIGLARAHAAAGKPFRVLVTAFTHAAAENVLRKVLELTRLQPPSELNLIVGKVKEWKQGQPSDGVEAPKDGLDAWVTARSHVVLGTTVLGVAKQGALGTGFDLVIIDEASQMRVADSAIAVSRLAAQGRLILAGDDLQLPPIVKGAYPERQPGEPLLHRSIFEAVKVDLADGSPALAKLLENRRMNDVLTSYAATLLYGADYRCATGAIAAHRLPFSWPDAPAFVSACLDRRYPMVVVVLEGVQATSHNPIEACLVADLAIALRDHLHDQTGAPYASDREFFRHGLFMVSPHRAQNRAIKEELTRRRAWDAAPFADTVDKMQGQEADAVLVSYGVADPEYAVDQAKFIYGVNRLNVAITRARSKSVVFLSKPLLDALPGVINVPEAEQGLAFMRNLVDLTRDHGETIRFDLGDGVTAVVLRSAQVLPGG